MSFAIRKDTYFTEVVSHFSAVKCRCGVSFLLLALLCTWHTFLLLLSLGKKIIWVGLEDFWIVMVIGKIDIFPLLLFPPLLLPSFHFKPAAVSGQAVEFRECHSFYTHIYYITINTKRRNCYQFSSSTQCCAVYISEELYLILGISRKVRN